MMGSKLRRASRGLWLSPLWLFACTQGDGAREPSALQFCAELEEPEDSVAFEETPVGRHGKLHVEGQYLLDENDERVQLKGVSSMWLNWEGNGYATDRTGLLWMRDEWGISVIRGAVGASEADGTPVAGGYHEDPDAMREAMEEIVDNATELGVYAIIDWHSHAAHLHLDAAKEFFEHFSRRYADHENVIYEPFNEPIMVEGDDWGTGEQTWNEQLVPYHQEIIETIRENDDDAVIILGTPRWSQIVTAAAKNPVPGENLMYTLHFYACTHTEDMRVELRNALDLGLPIFVTEWGATDASGGTSDKTVCSAEADAWHQLMDQHSISSAAWKLDDCTDASCFFRQGAPTCGHWKEEEQGEEGWLQGHGRYVLEHLRGERPAGQPTSSDAGAPFPDAGTQGRNDGGR